MRRSALEISNLAVIFALGATLIIRVLRDTLFAMTQWRAPRLAINLVHLWRFQRRGSVDRFD
jgi:hypothetical protein